MRTQSVPVTAAHASAPQVSAQSFPLAARLYEWPLCVTERTGGGDGEGGGGEGEGGGGEGGGELAFA
jgi:hypothetical protein